jgi:hypothetical protein
MKMGELKPCPFCGGTKLMICDSPCGWSAGGKAYAVTCCARDCHGAIFSLGHDLFATPHEAVASWNIRAFDQAAELRGAEKMRDAAIIAVRGSNADLYKSAVAAYQAAVSSIRILDPSVIVKDQSNG